MWQMVRPKAGNLNNALGQTTQKDWDWAVSFSPKTFVFNY